MKHLYIYPNILREDMFSAGRKIKTISMRAKLKREGPDIIDIKYAMLVYCSLMIHKK